MSKKFVVDYRKGTPERCEWWRLFTKFDSRIDAEVQAAKIEKNDGYHTQVQQEGEEMPVGWAPGSVDPESDRVEIIEGVRTQHIRGER